DLAAAAEAALGESGARGGRLRRLAALSISGVVLVAGLATGLVLALGGGAGSTSPRRAAAPIRYRGTLSEPPSPAAAGAQPDITFYAVLDDGHGVLQGLGSGPPPPTGEISFRIDRRQ